MERGTSFRPGDYTSDDIERWLAERRLVEETALRGRLERIGVIAIEPRPGSEGVEAMVMGDATRFGGETDALAAAVVDNASKLAECRPRVTHLVVGVSRFGVSRDATATAVPELPESIDHLWVINRWRPPAGKGHLWRADRGDLEWSLHEEPDPPTIRDERLAAGDDYGRQMTHMSRARDPVGRASVTRSERVVSGADGCDVACRDPSSLRV